jgi:hypothetical protein
MMMRGKLNKAWYKKKVCVQIKFYDICQIFLNSDELSSKQSETKKF